MGVSANYSAYIPYHVHMTTNTNVLYEEMTPRMQRAIKDAASNDSHTISFSDHRLDAEAQVFLGLPDSPFESAVYDSNMSLGGSPACYVLSDEIMEHLSH